MRPGPVYNLPTLVGYVGHDPTRRRYPAYSLPKRTGMYRSSVGSGPCYNFTKITHHGRENPPAYSIGGRSVVKSLDFGPGPGAYKPEKCPLVNHNKRSPLYSIQSKGKSLLVEKGPAPNAYYLPSCIGTKVPHKTAAAGFTISGFHRSNRPDNIGPGPAAYLKIDDNVIKRRSPAYTLTSRHVSLSRDFSPGPEYYPLYNIRKNPPRYSFGVKYKECVMTPITDFDEE